MVTKDDKNGVLLGLKGLWSMHLEWAADLKAALAEEKLDAGKREQIARTILELELAARRLQQEILAVENEPVEG